MAGGTSEAREGGPDGGGKGRKGSFYGRERRRRRRRKRERESRLDFRRDFDEVDEEKMR